MKAKTLRGTPCCPSCRAHYGSAQHAAMCCVHRWRVGSPDGSETLHGVCGLCGAEKEFRARSRMYRGGTGDQGRGRNRCKDRLTEVGEAVGVRDRLDHARGHSHRRGLWCPAEGAR